jgi:4-alpha-glucanotransferase
VALRERGHSAGDERRAYRAATVELAASRAAMMLVNLEDEWGETEPQNVPGTTADEQPNWQRRLRYGVDELSSVDGLEEHLSAVDAARRAVA